MTTRIETPTRPYLLEQIDDAAVVQLYADGFAALGLREKTLIWHLYLAALAGRDIYFDQRHPLALEMRGVLEAVLRCGDSLDDDVLAEIRRYTKLFWINTGPYNNLTARKFVLKLSHAALREAARHAEQCGAALPRRHNETVDGLVERLAPMFLDPAVDPFVTCKTPGNGGAALQGPRDILEASANNLYAGVRMADLEAIGDSAGFTERYGLNSRLVKSQDGRLEEEVYRLGGRYGDAIARIIGHLEDAMAFATPAMRRALEALVMFYRTGEDADRAAYDIAWVEDKESPVDTINGFVEVYMDARGVKGAWEALVFYVNPEKTAGIQRLAEAAAWFEARMPWDPAWRRADVRGVTARAIDVVVETGDSGPVTPVGINLPNDQAIREKYGSKSVSLSNVAEAYDKSTPEAFRREFAWSEEEAARAAKWASFASELTTNIHEVLGHGSGRVAEHLAGQPQLALKELYSTLEEARADLVALYFVADPKMIELALVPADDHTEIVLAEYESYARNALVQLRRVREGSTIEEDHMRNRQLIVHWLLANTGAIEIRRRDGKTYHVVVDVAAFRDGAGRLLADVQRIKSEGDYEAARRLVETYGVHFDPALRDEVVARVAKLNMPSYTGFVMPQLEPVLGTGRKIVDVKVSYPLDLEKQMLNWSARD